jgi:hypothetical protein
VVADCVGPPSTQPSTITLACADDGIGIQGITWGTWTNESATGHATLWMNLCQPDCAAGKTADYPVQVTLSDVQASAQGRWFKSLTIGWESPRPSPLPLTTYALLGPS